MLFVRCAVLVAAFLAMVGLLPGIRIDRKRDGSIVLAALVAIPIALLAYPIKSLILSLSSQTSLLIAGWFAISALAVVITMKVAQRTMTGVQVGNLGHLLGLAGVLGVVATVLNWFFL